MSGRLDDDVSYTTKELDSLMSFQSQIYADILRPFSQILNATSEEVAAIDPRINSASPTPL